MLVAGSATWTADVEPCRAKLVTKRVWTSVWLQRRLDTGAHDASYGDLSPARDEQVNSKLTGTARRWLTGAKLTTMGVFVDVSLR